MKRRMCIQKWLSKVSRTAWQQICGVLCCMFCHVDVMTQVHQPTRRPLRCSFSWSVCKLWVLPLHRVFRSGCSSTLIFQDQFLRQLLVEQLSSCSGAYCKHALVVWPLLLVDCTLHARTSFSLTLEFTLWVCFRMCLSQSSQAP